MEDQPPCPHGPETPPISHLEADIVIHAGVNGWSIHRGRPPMIVVEKIEGRDNVAHLLAQVATLMGERS